MRHIRKSLISLSIAIVLAFFISSAANALVTLYDVGSSSQACWLIAEQTLDPNILACLERGGEWNPDGYCDFEQDNFGISRAVPTLMLVLGIIAMAFGWYGFKVETIRHGVVFGGVLSIAYALLQGEQFATMTVLIGMLLVALIWFANKEELNPPARKRVPAARRRR
ncbi:MAG: hypothetical protein JW727_05865 [Candidatus Aenigmarchaeota archaeon]|nr:hypothetical protein [Candidatus Aenigmarchaeota archaeon]